MWIIHWNACYRHNNSTTRDNFEEHLNASRAMRPRGNAPLTLCQPMGSILAPRLRPEPSGWTPGRLRGLDALHAATMSLLRVLEILFFLYFASHIPITLFIDLQALLPKDLYPQPVSVAVESSCWVELRVVRFVSNCCPPPHTPRHPQNKSCGACWSGTRPTSRTPWWRSLRTGSGPSCSARLWSSCPSSPSLLTPSSKVSHPPPPPRKSSATAALRMKKLTFRRVGGEGRANFIQITNPCSWIEPLRLVRICERKPDLCWMPAVTTLPMGWRGWWAARSARSLFCCWNYRKIIILKKNESEASDVV